MDLQLIIGLVLSVLPVFEIRGGWGSSKSSIEGVGIDFFMIGEFGKQKLMV